MRTVLAILKVDCVLKVDLSRSNPFPTGFVSSNEIITNRADDVRKTSPILSMKGNSTKKALNKNEAITEIIAVAIAAFAVVRFQKNPKSGRKPGLG